MKQAGISAIVLAAGKSERMGRQKMLMPWGERTVLGQVINSCLQAGISDVLVITGGQHQQVEDEASNYPVSVVCNSNSASGEMLSSIQTGLKNQNAESAAVLVVLGDQPQMQTQTILDVCAAYAHSSKDIIVPSFENQRGHPYLIEKRHWAEILSMRNPASMRDFFRAHTGAIEYITAGNSVLKDLDTPEVYQAEKPATTKLDRKFGGI